MGLELKWKGLRIDDHLDGSPAAAGFTCGWSVIGETFRCYSAPRRVARLPQTRAHSAPHYRPLFAGEHERQSARADVEQYKWFSHGFPSDSD